MSSSWAIETRALRRSFGPFEALRGVDLRVSAGSIFGLVGPNGAGKTTTFSILCGFLHPTSGEARVLGCDPRDRAALVGRVGALPQDAPLPARMRTLDFLRYLAELGGLSPSDARAEALRWLSLVGLEAQAHNRMSELSHGMAKRVALAQAFLGSPDLVLLDEPTSGLDPNQIREVRETIRRLGEKKTILLSTHILQEVEALADRVVLIADGRLRFDGTPAELRKEGRGLDERFHELTRSA